MMALTLAQPHATLAAHGFKQADGRGWKTGYRGLVAIYAARWRAGLDRRAFKALCLSDPFHDPLYEALSISRCADLPRGMIVGLAELIEAERIEDDADLPSYPEREFGLYGPLRCIWRLEDARALPSPIPVRRGWARSGLWQVPRPLRAKLKAMEGGAR
jgi:hypothetical protein